MIIKLHSALTESFCVGARKIKLRIYTENLVGWHYFVVHLYKLLVIVLETCKKKPKRKETKKYALK